MCWQQDFCFSFFLVFFSLFLVIFKQWVEHLSRKIYKGVMFKVEILTNIVYYIYLKYVIPKKTVLITITVDVSVYTLTYTLNVYCLFETGKLGFVIGLNLTGSHSPDLHYH